MRKNLTEQDEFEIDQSLDDDLQERVKNIYLLRGALERHSHMLIDDWGSVQFNVNDEFSYDLGRHDGLELAIRLLENDSKMIPEKNLVH